MGRHFLGDDKNCLDTDACGVEQHYGCAKCHCIYLECSHDLFYTLCEFDYNLRKKKKKEEKKKKKRPRIFALP